MEPRPPPVTIETIERMEAECTIWWQPPIWWDQQPSWMSVPPRWLNDVEVQLQEELAAVRHQTALAAHAADEATRVADAARAGDFENRCLSLTHACSLRLLVLPTVT